MSFAGVAEADATLEAFAQIDWQRPWLAALRESGRDFGTAHISDGPLRIKFELPKKVSWDQKKLKAIAERIVASGEAVESYLDVKLAVPESRYTNWPPALQQQFADARTVEAGKAVFDLSLGQEA